MKALALCALALAACSMSKSAERQDSFGQEVESRRDEGPVRVVETVEEFAVAASRADEGIHGGTHQPSPASPSGQPILRRTVTVTDRAPVVVSTKTQTDASGEAHTASASRFGFSPWQWAIGAVVLACGLYGAFWVKRKLAL